MSNVTTELDGSPVLNPFDSLAFIPPELVSHVLLMRYVYVGTLGAFIWDILNNMVGNYRILFQRRIRLPTVVYFISTISSLAYIIGATIFQTAPLSSCSTLKKSLEVIYSIAIPSTSLLFFFRTRAVFDRDTWVVVFFAGMWLAVLGVCLAPIADLPAANLGPTSYCMNFESKPYAVPAVIMPLINDTLIFIAITWRLYCNSTARGTIEDGVRVLIFGDHLPAFSKAMLQDGQAYYLSTVTFNLLTVVFLYVTSIPAVLRTLPGIPNLALMNMMACRVFRNMILGLPRESEISTSLISREIRAIHSVISLSLPEERSGNGIKQGPNTSLNVAGITAGRTHDCAADDKGHINISAIV